MRQFPILLSMISLSILSGCVPPAEQQDEVNYSQHIEQLEETISVLEAKIDTLENQMDSPQINSSTSANQDADEPAAPQGTIQEDSLPEGPVQAGRPVIMDNWALTLNDEVGIDNWNYNSAIALTVTIRNTADKDRIFRYVKSGFEVSDDLGNIYPFEPCENHPDDIYLTQQFSVSAGDDEEIYTSGMYGCIREYAMPAFSGPIDMNASRLIVKINQWGPFSDLEFFIDL